MAMPEPRTQGLDTQRKCPECEEEVRRQPVEEEEEEETLQAKHMSSRPPEPTPDMEAQLGAMRGGGQPLPQSERAFFEPRFGYDFSRVRLHTDANAAEAASALNARSFAIGEHMAFGAGEYVPNASHGRRLVAHELTHILQQRGQRPRVQCKSASGGGCPPREEGEIEASARSPCRLVERVPEKEWLLYDFRVGSGHVEPEKGDVYALAQPIEASIMRGRLFAVFPIEDKRLEVLGYTDCHGSDAVNRRLRESRAEDFCNAVKRDKPFEDFFLHQILSCRSAPLESFAASNASREGRSKNRSVLIRVVSAKGPPSPLPYDTKYNPRGLNCATYLLASKYLGDAFANNAFCACTHTPDEPHNNCVRKCLQEKLRVFLAANAKDLQAGRFIWCPSIWKHHRDCYRECGCDNQFVSYLAFRLMCADSYRCPAVGLSIAIFNPCMKTIK